MDGPSSSSLCSSCSHEEGLMKMPAVGDRQLPKTAETFLTLRLEEMANKTVGSPPTLENDIITLPAEAERNDFSKRRLSHSEEHSVGPFRKRLRTSAASTKTVRFMEDSCLVQEATFHATDQELRDAWYCKRDYLEFQEDTQSTVLAFELGILDHIPEEDVCLRGLEAHLSNTMLEARISGREAMISFILKTQELQRVHQMYDDEFIRGLSLTLSHNSCDDALKLAAFDSDEAREVLADLRATRY